MAAFATIQHFQELLECRSFQLWTDHKPLVAALESATTPKPPRRQRQMAYISEFTTDVVHTPGTSNVVADLLSRPPPTAENATNSNRQNSGTGGAHCALYAALSRNATNRTRHYSGSGLRASVYAVRHRHRPRPFSGFRQRRHTRRHTAD